MISARYRTPVMIERNRTRSYVLDVRDGAGAAATVTSGTYLVLDQSGATVASGSCTITSGVPSFSLLGSVTEAYEYSHEWSISWVLLIVGVTHEIRQEAHLVRHPLRPVIDATDLARRHSNITSEYTVAQLQVFVDEAFDEIQSRLIAEGKYPQHVFSDWAIATPHRSLALSFAMRDLATYSTGRGKYSEEADRYHEMYDDQWGQVAFKLDKNQDGVAEEHYEAGDGVIWLWGSR